MSTAVKPKAPPGNGSSSMKPTTSSTTTAAPKPNAWMKPLQPKQQQPQQPPKPEIVESAPPPPVNLLALRERFLHLLLTLIGQKVTITMQNGTTYTGILHTATPFEMPENKHKYVLKAVTCNDPDLQPGTTVLLDMEHVVQAVAKSVRLDNNNNNSNPDMAAAAFTDTEISSATTTLHDETNKELVQAHSTWTEESQVKLSKSAAGWDQFKANEELFNVQAKFDETVYTTVLDRSQISKPKQLRAEQMAREIESSASTNIHVSEERGHVDNQDYYDEEDRYSGVLKQQPKLNYAQVAKKTEPPGFEKVAADDQAALAEAIAKVKVAEPVAQVTEPVAEEEEEEKASSSTVENGGKEEQKEEAAVKPPTPEESKSKLNANAKEFSLNINAKSFTPGGVPQQPPPPPPHFPPPPPQQFFDPITGMPIPMMAQMPIQPGMMPHMMNPQFGMRYQYPGMEAAPIMPVMQPQHSIATSATASPVPTTTTTTDDQVLQQPDDSASMDSSSQQQQPVPFPHNTVPPYMPYMQHQAAYYAPPPPTMNPQFMHHHPPPPPQYFRHVYAPRPPYYPYGGGYAYEEQEPYRGGGGSWNGGRGGGGRGRGRGRGGGGRSFRGGRLFVGGGRQPYEQQQQTGEAPQNESPQHEQQTTEK